MRALTVRVPLASGLLTGKFTKDSVFDKKGHRHFNREGKSFDVGETFSGIPYEKGVEAVERLKEVPPDDRDLAHLALQWILMRDEVVQEINKIYNIEIKPLVHQRW